MGGFEKRLESEADAPRRGWEMRPAMPAAGFAVAFTTAGIIIRFNC